MTEAPKGGKTDRMLYAIADCLENGPSLAIVVAVDDRQRDYFTRAVSERTGGRIQEEEVALDNGSLATFVSMDSVFVDPRDGRVRQRNSVSIFCEAPSDAKVFVDHRVLEQLFGWALAEYEAYRPQNMGERKETQVDGYVEGPTLEKITPKTATCTQVGASLGLTFAKVSALAKRHGITPAGEAVYDLGNGRTNDDLPARTFDLTGWEQIRDAALKENLISAGKNYAPPSQLRSGEPAS